MITHLTTPVSRSTDLNALHNLLKVLVFQRCFKAEVGYADEFMLHLGDPAPYPQARMKGEQKGSWVLGTRASEWQVLFDDPPPTLIAVPDAPAFLGPIQPGPGLVGCHSHARLTPADGAVKEVIQRLAGRSVTQTLLFPIQSTTTFAKGVGLKLEFTDGCRVTITPNWEECEPDEEPVADWEIFTPYHMYLKVGPGLAWSYLRSDVVADEG